MSFGSWLVDVEDLEYKILASCWWGVWNGLEAFKCSMKIRRLNNWGSMMYLPACFCFIPKEINCDSFIRFYSLMTRARIIPLPGTTHHHYVFRLRDSKKNFICLWASLEGGEGYPKNYTSWCFTMKIQSVIIWNYNKRWCETTQNHVATLPYPEVFRLSGTQYVQETSHHNGSFGNSRKRPRVSCAWLKKSPFRGCRTAGVCI